VADRRKRFATDGRSFTLGGAPSRSAAKSNVASSGRKRRKSPVVGWSSSIRSSCWDYARIVARYVNENSPRSRHFLARARRASEFARAVLYRTSQPRAGCQRMGARRFSGNFSGYSVARPRRNGCSPRSISIRTRAFLCHASRALLRKKSRCVSFARDVAPGHALRC